ncbi:MAG: NepR family anti-sigma factor [Hyphomicrobium sp.]
MSATRDSKDDSMTPSIATPLPKELQGQIGNKLREAYSQLVAEPVPDRILELLQKLKSKESDPQGGGA